MLIWVVFWGISRFGGTQAHLLPEELAQGLAEFGVRVLGG